LHNKELRRAAKLKKPAYVDPLTISKPDIKLRNGDTDIRIHNIKNIAVKPSENMEYSVIIPTMWVPEKLLDILEIYDNCKYITEIILIDNNPTKNKLGDFKSDKLKVYTKNCNIYVNPAWNWGVELATNENIIIANDDVFITLNNLNGLIEKVINKLRPDTIFAPSEKCFNKSINSDIQITEVKGSSINYGFGTFMIMKKKSYTIIPDDILIFYGDNIQAETNKIYNFHVNIDTKMSVTIHSSNELRFLCEKDHEKIIKYKKNYKLLPKFK